MPHDQVQVIATMSETGRVYIYDITQHVDAFDTPGLIPPRDTKPLHTITNHGAYEGYAMDWSSLTSGSLLTGDGKGRIFHTIRNTAGFSTDKNYFSGRTSSVEDIQWSPSQATVFASCSADQVFLEYFTNIKVYMYMGFQNKNQTSIKNPSPHIRRQCNFMEQKSRLLASIRIRLWRIFYLGFTYLA